MVIRTYFDKNNTIIYNSQLNTAKNPVTELFYGGQPNIYSRFIFHFDEERLKKLYEDNTFSDISKLEHRLKMVNTGFFDSKLLGKNTCSGKKRSTSFDLIVFKIPQYWDEGVGYDYIDCDVDGEIVTSVAPSNWFQSETTVDWDGIYSGTNIEIVGQQHFDQGNENIDIDITDIVNSYITGETNYGLGIAYRDDYEELFTDEQQYVGFFTKYTQTFYEPYIETVYKCKIKDDRHKFYIGKKNKLYLYSNVHGTPHNLDEIPTVDIIDNCGQLFTSFTQNDVVQCTKGVYYVELEILEDLFEDGILFNDVWRNIKINGISRKDIELSFELKPSDEYYNIGDNDLYPKKVIFNVSGINNNEKVNRGDVRKVFIHPRIPYTTNQYEILDSIQYRLYVKEGRNELTVIDYTDVEMANNIYFLLDTQSLIPNTYYLDVKYASNLEVSNFKDVIKFDIISEVRDRISQ
jgi:hypothetical protein